MTFGPLYVVPAVAIGVWIYSVRGQRLSPKLFPWFGAIALYLAAPIVFGTFQDPYVVLGWVILVVSLAGRAFREGAYSAALILLILPAAWTAWSVLLFTHRATQTDFWLAMAAVPATMFFAFLVMILWENRRNAA